MGLGEVEEGRDGRRGRENTFVNTSRIERNDVAAGVGHGGCFGVRWWCLWGAGGDVC
jgi:hypothetical protein